MAKRYQHKSPYTRAVAADDPFAPPDALKTRIIRPGDPDWPGDAPIDENASVPFRQPISEGPPPLSLEEIVE